MNLPQNSVQMNIDPFLYPFGNGFGTSLPQATVPPSQYFVAHQLAQIDPMARLSDQVPTMEFGYGPSYVSHPAQSHHIVPLTDCTRFSRPPDINRTQ